MTILILDIKVVENVDLNKVMKQTSTSIVVVICRAPKFLVDPLEGPSMRQCGRSWNLEHDPDFQH
jgi:hypothetical protein